MISLEEIHPSRRRQPCEKCGGPFGETEDRIITFFDGSFIFLHEDCADFMEHATPGPRAATDTGEG